jgi:transposase
MPKTFRPYVPEQYLLLPPSISDWLPEGHLARFVGDVVEQLDLSAIEDAYGEERGYPPYNPRMMTKVLLYAYATGTYASRRIAKQLVDSVAFRYLASGNSPDFRTISGFRKRHGTALSGLFDQVLDLCCQSAGLVKLGRVAVDGTKIKANASKHKAMSYGRMAKKKTEIREVVRRIFEEADRIDEEEDRLYGEDKSGDELPEELQTQEGRLKKIREAMAELKERAKKKAEADGKDPQKAKPAKRDQYNFTDPESRIQKTSDGFIQGYNVQIAVDAHAQVIVGQHVAQNSPDAPQLMPAINQVCQRFNRVPKQVLADAGYWSESNVWELRKKDIDPYIPPERIKHGDAALPAPRGRKPRQMSMKARMQRKLRTIRGRAIYASRKILPEPVFGQIKQARGFRQFLRRGLVAVGQEWSLVSTAHNILKLYAATT